MNEVELNEMLGSELFDRLSQDDKKLILHTAGSIDWIKYTEGIKEINKPCDYYPFYVIDKILGKVILHPVFNDGIEALNIVDRESAQFAIDNYGELIVLNDFGYWIYAPERYTCVINRDFRKQ